MEEYSPVNSLVLLVASNIAFLESDELPQYAKEQLGIQVPPMVFQDKEKKSDALGVVLYDDQKIIVSFRGPLSCEPGKLKKALGLFLSVKKSEKKIFCLNYSLFF